MGLKAFLKSLFVAKPFVVDYGPLDDDRLVDLWKERLKLIPSAREALLAEAARRGMDLAAEAARSREALRVEGAARREGRAPGEGTPRPAHDPGVPGDEDGPDGADAPIADARVVVVPPGGAALRTRGRKAVLCLLPVADGDPAWLRDLRLDGNLEIEAVVAFNEEPGGYLPTFEVARRLGVRADAVFVIDPARPADRPLPGLAGDPLPVRALPPLLDLGRLRLKAVPGHNNVVVARWMDLHDEARAGVAIGPAVPAGRLADIHVTGVVGGIEAPAPDLTGFAGAVRGLEQALLMPQVFGVVDLAGLLSSLGISVSIATWSAAGSPGPADGAFERVATALRAGDTAALRHEVAALDPGHIEVLLTGLIVGPDGEAPARALVDAACETHPDAGSVFFQLGLLCYLAGDLSGAAAAYESAAIAPVPEPRALSNLARVHKRRGALAESIATARRALSAIPSDAQALMVLLDGLLRIGQADEARREVAERGGVLDPVAREAWTRQAALGVPFPEGRDVFPKLADAAWRYAAEFRAHGRTDEAMVLLQRCLRFQPSRLDARMQLGAALAERGLEDQAIALLTEGLEFATTAGEAATLRFNRAACAARQGRYEVAREDLDACLKLAPEWDEAREQLAAVSERISRTG